MRTSVKRRRLVRFGAATFFVVALIGPWVYERVNVPAQYPCTAPNIRLEGDFCGVPLTGAFALWTLVKDIPGLAMGLISGAYGLVEATSALVAFGLVGLIVAAPIVSLVWAITDRGRRLWPLGLIGLWAVTLGLMLVLGTAPYARPLWAVWGVWVYAAVAAFALVFEALPLRAMARPGRSEPVA